MVSDAALGVVSPASCVVSSAPWDSVTDVSRHVGGISVLK